MRLLDVPLTGPLLWRRLDPAETWSFWELLAPGFVEPDRDLTERDLRDEDRARILVATAGQPTARRPSFGARRAVQRDPLRGAVLERDRRRLESALRPAFLRYGYP